MSNSRPLLCLLGPTASGKTELALQIAQQRRVALISVDSAMVYRGMDIGTAKPDPSTLQKFPHALIDIRDPEQGYSVANFVDESEKAISAAFAADRVPLLVGGTMLYFKALLEGLAELPTSVPDVRERLAAQARERGLPALHRRLAEVDPHAAARIDPNNGQRLLRALEVFEITGKPISSFWAQQKSRGVAQRLDCQPVCVGLVVPREEIHARVAVRFQDMVAAGLYDEVAQLRKRPGLQAETAAMRAVGYRQVWEFLEGSTPEAEMIERATAATRQLAKRQLTWMRSWDELHTIDPRSGAAAGVALQYLDAVAIVD